MPSPLYDFGSQLSFLGASVFVVLASGVTAALSNRTFNPVLVGFLFALLVSTTGIPRLKRDPKFRTSPLWFLIMLAFFLSILIFAQAAGINSINHGFLGLRVSSNTLIPFIDPVPWFPPASQQAALRQATASLREIQKSADALSSKINNPELVVRVRILAIEGRLRVLEDDRAELEQELAGLAPGEKRQAVERRLAEVQREEDEVKNLLGRVRMLEQVTIEWRRADREAGSVILSSLVDDVDRATGEVSKAIPQLVPIAAPMPVLPPWF